MPSITTWTRLEPHTRGDRLERGLEAAVHDPVWLLARQWQLGEFAGEDTGSPVIARARIESSRVSRVALGPDGEGRDLPAGAPLDPMVETAALRSATGDFRERVETGVQLLRMLEKNKLPASVRTAIVAAAALGVPSGERLEGLDEDTRRYLRMVTGRVPDGVLVAEEVRAAARNGGTGPAVPARWRIPQPRRAALRTILAEWLQWYAALFPDARPDQSAWIPERLEHDFRVAARGMEGELVFRAREFDGGPLDWHAFDLEPGTLGAELSSVTRVEAAIPAPATFRGMPASRWWEFEDSQVDFGAIDVEPEDLARLLLIEFAVSYGNDWFVIPIDLECGASGRVHWLLVTDSFGVRTLIPHYAGTLRPGSWSMWAHAADEGAPVAPWLLLPPAAGRTINSPPIEDVMFMRDEVANAAWAIERIVPSATGRPLDRARELDEDAERRREAIPPTEARPDQAVPLTYKLASFPPANWIPFLPERRDSPAIRLRKGITSTDPGAVPSGPRGLLLGDPERGTTWLFEEEVPRSGVRVTFRFRYTRWIDGSTHLWLGRQKLTGRGEGSSGLRFDQITPAE